MSLDRNDFSQETQQNAFGNSQRFWPINISPTSIGVEFEVNITPCDHIWLPVFFDPALGLNPCQVAAGTAILGDGNVFFPYCGPWGSYMTRLPGVNAGNSISNLSFPGMNAFDVYDYTANPQGTSGLNTQLAFLCQAAPVYAFRFNSPNAPWLLWTLSNLLSQSGYATAQGKGKLIGSGDAMRAISGPISRMWARLIMPAVGQPSNLGINPVTNPGTPYTNPTVTINGSRLLLMSSLGFSQTSVMSSQNCFAGLGQSQMDNTGPTLNTYGGGGYRITDLNTLDTLMLEQLGLGTRRQP